MARWRFAPSLTPIAKCSRLTPSPPEWMDMVLENIRYEQRPPIAVVTLDRPKVLNALNRQSMTELEQVFLDLQKSAEVRAVLLTGAGEKAFVAGADIGELASLSPLEGERLPAPRGGILLFIGNFRNAVV